LAAEIVKALDREELTVRAGLSADSAHNAARRGSESEVRVKRTVPRRVLCTDARTGFAAADFSRIRSAGLATSTADRLMSILNRLGSRVEVQIRVRSGEDRARVRDLPYLPEVRL
jgi:hypothetical protein